MAKRKRGRPTVFSPRQNRALRVELTRLLNRFGSRARLGDAIGVAQQNASRLLNDANSGFSYATATTVAQLAGFVGVDAFFRNRGVDEPSAEESHRQSA